MNAIAGAPVIRPNNTTKNTMISNNNAPNTTTTTSTTSSKPDKRIQKKDKMLGFVFHPMVILFFQTTLSLLSIYLIWISLRAWITLLASPEWIDFSLQRVEARQKIDLLLLPSLFNNYESFSFTSKLFLIIPFFLRHAVVSILGFIIGMGYNIISTPLPFVLLQLGTFLVVIATVIVIMARVFFSRAVAARRSGVKQSHLRKTLATLTKTIKEKVNSRLSRLKLLSTLKGVQSSTSTSKSTTADGNESSLELLLTQYIKTRDHDYLLPPGLQDLLRDPQQQMLLEQQQKQQFLSTLQQQQLQEQQSSRHHTHSPRTPRHRLRDLNHSQTPNSSHGLNLDLIVDGDEKNNNTIDNNAAQTNSDFTIFSQDDFTTEDDEDDYDDEYDYNEEDHNDDHKNHDDELQSNTTDKINVEPLEVHSDDEIDQLTTSIDDDDNMKLLNNNNSTQQNNSSSSSSLHPHKLKKSHSQYNIAKPHLNQHQSSHEVAKLSLTRTNSTSADEIKLVTSLADDFMGGFDAVEKDNAFHELIKLTEEEYKELITQLPIAAASINNTTSTTTLPLSSNLTTLQSPSAIPSPDDLPSTHETGGNDDDNQSSFTDLTTTTRQSNNNSNTSTSYYNLVAKITKIKSNLIKYKRLLTIYHLLKLAHYNDLHRAKHDFTCPVHIYSKLYTGSVFLIDKLYYRLKAKKRLHAAFLAQVTASTSMRMNSKNTNSLSVHSTTSSTTTTLRKDSNNDNIVIPTQFIPQSITQPVLDLLLPTVSRQKSPFHHQVREMMELIAVKNGTEICTAGQPANYLYIVLEGECWGYVEDLCVRHFLNGGVVGVEALHCPLINNVNDIDIKTNNNNFSLDDNLVEEDDNNNNNTITNYVQTVRVGHQHHQSSQQHLFTPQCTPNLTPHTSFHLPQSSSNTNHNHTYSALFQSNNTNHHSTTDLSSISLDNYSIFLRINYKDWHSLVQHNPIVSHSACSGILSRVARNAQAGLHQMLPQPYYDMNIGITPGVFPSTIRQDILTILGNNNNNNNNNVIKPLNPSQHQPQSQQDQEQYSVYQQIASVIDTPNFPFQLIRLRPGAILDTSNSTISQYPIEGLTKEHDLFQDRCQAIDFYTKQALPEGYSIATSQSPWLIDVIPRSSIAREAFIVLKGNPVVHLHSFYQNQPVAPSFPPEFFLNHPNDGNFNSLQQHHDANLPLTASGIHNQSSFVSTTGSTSSTPLSSATTTTTTASSSHHTFHNTNHNDSMSTLHLHPPQSRLSPPPMVGSKVSIDGLLDIQKLNRTGYYDNIPLNYYNTSKQVTLQQDYYNNNIVNNHQETLCIEINHGNNQISTQQQSTSPTPTPLQFEPKLGLPSSSNSNNRVFSSVSSMFIKSGDLINGQSLFCNRPCDVVGIGNIPSHHKNDKNNINHNNLNDNDDDDVILLVLNRHDLDVYLRNHERKQQQQLQLQPDQPLLTSSVSSSSSTTLHQQPLSTSNVPSTPRRTIADNTIAMAPSDDITTSPITPPQNTTTTTPLRSKQSSKPQLPSFLHATITPLSSLPDIRDYLLSHAMFSIYTVDTRLLLVYTRLGMRSVYKASDNVVMQSSSALSSEICIVTSGKCLLTTQPLAQQHKLLSQGNVVPETTTSNLKGNSRDHEVVVCNCEQGGKNTYVEEVHRILHYQQKRRIDRITNEITSFSTTNLSSQQQQTVNLPHELSVNNSNATKWLTPMSPNMQSNPPDFTFSTTQSTTNNLPLFTSATSSSFGAIDDPAFSQSSHINQMVRPADPTDRENFDKTPVYGLEQNIFRITSTPSSIESHVFQTKVSVGEVVGMYDGVNCVLSLLQQYGNGPNQINKLNKKTKNDLNAYFIATRTLRGRTLDPHAERLRQLRLDKLIPQCLSSVLNQTDHNTTTSTMKLDTIHDTEVIAMSINSLLLWSRENNQSLLNMSRSILSLTQQLTPRTQQYQYSHKSSSIEPLVQPLGPEIPSKTGQILTIVDGADREQGDYSLTQVNNIDPDYHCFNPAVLDEFAINSLSSIDQDGTSLPPPLQQHQQQQQQQNFPIHDHSSPIDLKAPFHVVSRQITDSLQRHHSVLSVSNDDINALFGYYSYRHRFDPVLSIILPPPTLTNLTLEEQTIHFTLLSQHLIRYNNQYRRLQHNLRVFLFNRKLYNNSDELKSYRLGLAFNILERFADTIVCLLEHRSTAITYQHADNLNSALSHLSTQQQLQEQSQKTLVSSVSGDRDHVITATTAITTSVSPPSTTTRQVNNNNSSYSNPLIHHSHQQLSGQQQQQPPHHHHHPHHPHTTRAQQYLYSNQLININQHDQNSTPTTTMGSVPMTTNSLSSTTTTLSPQSNQFFTATKPLTQNRRNDDGVVASHQTVTQSVYDVWTVRNAESIIIVQQSLQCQNIGWCPFHRKHHKQSLLSPAAATAAAAASIITTPPPSSSTPIQSTPSTNDDQPSSLSPIVDDIITSLHTPAHHIDPELIKYIHPTLPEHMHHMDPYLGIIPLERKHVLKHFKSQLETSLPSSGSTNQHRFEPYNGPVISTNPLPLCSALSPATQYVPPRPVVKVSQYEHDLLWTPPQLRSVHTTTSSSINSTTPSLSQSQAPLYLQQYQKQQQSQQPQQRGGLYSHRFLGRPVRHYLFLYHAPCVHQPLYSSEFIASGPRRVDSVIHARLKIVNNRQLTFSKTNNNNDITPNNDNTNNSKNNNGYMVTQYEIESCDLDRLSRRFLGLHVALVCGGGGARGLSHVGVIAHMLANYIPPDCLAGTSQGAWASALFATSHPSLYYKPQLFEKHPLPPHNLNISQITSFLNNPESKNKAILPTTSISLYPMFHRVLSFCQAFSQISTLLADSTLPLLSFFTGFTFNNLVCSALGYYGDVLQVEDCWTPIVQTSTNISRARLGIHRDGPLWHSTRASMCVIGLLPPLHDPKTNDLLIDGGYINNLPADLALDSFSPRYVVSVDVENKDERHLQDITSITSPIVSGWYLAWLKIKRTFIPSNNPKATTFYPSYGDLIQSLFYISHGRQQHTIGRYIDSYIRPSVQEYQLLDYDKIDKIFMAGLQRAEYELGLFITSRVDLDVAKLDYLRGSTNFSKV